MNAEFDITGIKIETDRLILKRGTYDNFVTND